MNVRIIRKIENNQIMMETLSNVIKIEDKRDQGLLITYYKFSNKNDEEIVIREISNEDILFILEFNIWMKEES